MPKINQVAPEIVVSRPSNSTMLSEIHDPQPPRKSVGADSAVSSQSTGSTRSANIVDKEYREKMDLMKISDDRKEYLYTVRPEHDMGLSGWTSNGYFPSLVSKCPPGMEAMVPLALFFISKAGGTFNTIYDAEIDLGNEKYQIFSQTGEVLFYGVETLQAFESYPFSVKDIELTATGPRGGIVFQISGSNKFARVKNEDGELGTMTRYGLGPYFKPSNRHWSYVIRDAAGQEVCRIDCGTTQKNYTIHFPGSKRSVGAIKYNWPKSKYQLPEAQTENSLGVHFFSNAKKVNPAQKTLVLAATMLIYNNFVGPKENFGPNKTRFKYGLGYNLCVAGIILILAIVVLSVTLTHNPSGKKPTSCL